MNEFTKDELLLLRDCINYAYGNPMGPTYDTIYPLFEKVKSFIDNYCEHTWADGSGNTIYCAQCGVILGKR
jgi:hypothetical protein